MSTLTFNDGPKPVPPKSFVRYQQLRNPDFHDIMQIWWRRSIRDEGVLRLCVRDLLRQNYQSSRGNCHDLNGKYTYLLKSELNPGLYDLLCSSKNHRREFVSEALYILKNDLISPDDDDRTLLVEFLITLDYTLNSSKPSSIDIDRLWLQHPVNQIEPDPVHQAWKELEFCTNGMCLGMEITHRNRFTKPLHKQVWRRCRDRLAIYIDQLNPQLKQRGTVYSQLHPYDPHLIGYAEPPTSTENLIIRFCQMLDRGNMTLAKIQLLEEHLDAQVAYLDAKRLATILPQLENRFVAYRCLQRHVRLLSAGALKSLEPNSLFWAIGLSSYYGADDPEDRTAKRLINLVSKL